MPEDKDTGSKAPNTAVASVGDSTAVAILSGSPAKKPEEKKHLEEKVGPTILEHLLHPENDQKKQETIELIATLAKRKKVALKIDLQEEKEEEKIKACLSELLENLYDQPIQIVPVKNPGKLEMRDVLGARPEMSKALKVSKKEGGANSAGPAGGIYVTCYQDANGKIGFQSFLFKQVIDGRKVNHREHMAEVAGGRIMNLFAGNHVASTHFGIVPGGKIEDPNSIGVVSLYHDGFKDFNEAAHEKAAEIKRKEMLSELEDKLSDIDAEKKADRRAEENKKIEERVLKIKKTKRPKGPGAGQKIDQKDPYYRIGLKELIKEGELDLFALGRVEAAAAILGDTQGHSNNRAIITLANGEKSVGSIDYGPALRRFFEKGFLQATSNKESKRPFERIVRLMGEEGHKYRTVYFEAYPEREVLVNEKFIRGIDAVTAVNKAAVKEGIEAAIDYVEEFYGEEKLAEHLSAELAPKTELDPKSKDYVGKDEVVKATKQFLTDALLARQLSLAKFSLEKKLRHIELGGSEFARDKLVRSHPIYFLFDKKSPIRVKKELANEPLKDLILKDLVGKSNIEKFSRNFLAYLKQLDTFLNDNDVNRVAFIKYLEDALSSDYDFNKDTDKSVMIQICDTAYTMLVEAYEKSQNKQDFLAMLVPSTHRISSVPKHMIPSQQRAEGTYSSFGAQSGSLFKPMSVISFLEKSSMIKSKLIKIDNSNKAWKWEQKTDRSVSYQEVSRKKPGADKVEKFQMYAKELVTEDRDNIDTLIEIFKITYPPGKGISPIIKTTDDCADQWMNKITLADYPGLVMLNEEGKSIDLQKYKIVQAHSVTPSITQISRQQK